ncbi:MAG: geranylgeranyl reductase family protein [Desulfobacteraceae bacterium]|nr:MAG: geranylgeranyl reductase family protein [Desulfobacteraceae bacterium]
MRPDATCDVVVAGGGPAGATAAYLLAAQGLQVRLFDRSIFPRPKLCAGLLTWKTIDLLARLFAIGADDLIRNGLVTHTCRDYRIYYHRGEIARGRLDFPFHFADRSLYDHHWLKTAQSAGVRIETGSGVRRVDCGRAEVTLEDGRTIRAKIIIGADGVWSKVRRAIHANGLSQKGWRSGLAATIEAHQPYTGGTSEPAFASLHFGHVSWGYAWSFPGATRRTVGVACLPRKNGGSLRRAFSDCLEAMDAGAAPASWQSHPLPYGNYLRRPAHRRALLIGDACGLADPLLGEGIYYAHRSAEIAVQAITAAKGQWDAVASRYGSLLQRDLLRELRWIKVLRGLLFIGGQRRRYRGLKLFCRLFPKRLEATVQGNRPFSRLLLP